MGAVHERGQRGLIAEKPPQMSASLVWCDKAFRATTPTFDLAAVIADRTLRFRLGVFVWTSSGPFVVRVSYVFAVVVCRAVVFGIRVFGRVIRRQGIRKDVWPLSQSQQQIDFLVFCLEVVFNNLGPPLFTEGVPFAISVLSTRWGASEGSLTRHSSHSHHIDS